MGTSDGDGNLMRGTEIRSLVAFGGKLFAGAGIWMEPAIEADLPGPQVFVLDRSETEGGNWRQDFVLSETVEHPLEPGHMVLRYVAISDMNRVVFSKDRYGAPLSPPQEMIVAGVWDHLNSLEALVRSDSGQWVKDLIYQPSLSECGHGYHIRSLLSHENAALGVSEVIAGTNGHDLCGPSIRRGLYDPAQPSHIAWDAAPETWIDPPGTDDRVTSLTEANGKLYATVCEKLYERDDATRTWRMMYRWTVGHCDANPGENGFRRAVAVGAAGQQELFLAAEGGSSMTGTIQPLAGFTPAAELDMSDFLSSCLQTPVGYVIVGYNNILPFSVPAGTPALLMGLEAATPNANGTWHGWDPGGWMLLRYSPTHYELHEVRLEGISPTASLVGLRTLAESPFPNELGRILYAGGFDCNGQEAHDTAWLYRGELLDQ
jgi:hypothetical protein